MSAPRRWTDGDDDDHDDDDDSPRWIMQVVALYDYEPEEHDELAFHEGDSIRVIKVQGDGWWQGYAVDVPQRLGVFPSNYVRVQHRRPPASDTPQRHRIHQKHVHVTFTVPPDDDEEDEMHSMRLVQSTKTPSVLQLKQRLAEAERTSRAAQEARKKAEQEQLRRRQQRTVGTRQRQVEEDDEEENEDDHGFYTQEEWRYHQRQVEDTEEDEDDDEEEEEQVDHHRYGIYQENEEEEDDQEQDEDEDETTRPVDSTDQENDAATRIARRYRSHVQDVQRGNDDRRRKASRVITYSVRRHLQRSREKQQQRQAEAARAIQRWLVRAKSVKDSTQDTHEAAYVIQQWIRRRLAYWRWLQHVEAARDEMRRTHEAKRREEQLQRQREEDELRRQQDRQEEEAHERERVRREEERIQEEAQRKQQEKQVMEHQAQSETKKEKKRVMKREAIDLVKALVAQQLNDKLRDHDEQMMELQRMVTRLQDVICQQNEIIQQSANDVLDQQHPSPHPAKHRQLRIPGPSSISIDKATTGGTLPLIQQRPPLGENTRPSGIKPPRPIAKLPLLTPSTTATGLKR